MTPVLPGRVGRRRIGAAIALLAVIVAGLLTHLLVPGSAATDIAGDALYAAAAYLAIVVLAPRLRLLTVACLAAVWCIAVELFQLTGVPLAVGARFSPAFLVLGSTFAVRDLVVYVVAVVALAAGDAAVLRSGVGGSPWGGETPESPVDRTSLDAGVAQPPRRDR